jgi:transcription elongation GreA/GreB family factor
VPPISRARLKQALLDQARAALELARAAHAAAVEGATHSEARAENDKDTRGLEQSYLARGHAARVEETEGALGAIARLPEGTAGAKVAMGAVVTVEDDDGEQQRYYLAPWGGGVALPGNVLAVTPSSPIGAALVGKELGDDVEIQRPGGRRTLTVVELA